MKFFFSIHNMEFLNEIYEDTANILAPENMSAIRREKQAQSTQLLLLFIFVNDVEFAHFLSDAHSSCVFVYFKYNARMFVQINFL